MVARKLSELVSRELAPYATYGNVEIGGPDITLKPEAGQALSMVLHELTTNAAKHGALSARGGCVAVRWCRSVNDDADGRLAIEWQETGGPVVHTEWRSLAVCCPTSLVAKLIWRSLPRVSNVASRYLSGQLANGHGVTNKINTQIQTDTG
jgi:two-component sensor histidine kinase